MFGVVFTIITVGALAAVAYKYHTKVIAEYNAVEDLLLTKLEEAATEIRTLTPVVVRKKTSKKS